MDTTITLTGLWVSIEQILEPDEYRIFRMHYQGYPQVEIGLTFGICQQWAGRKLEEIKEKLKNNL